MRGRPDRAGRAALRLERGGTGRGGDPAVKEGTGELQHIIEWRSDGSWRSTERISYQGRLGDETVTQNNGDRTSLARSYATWIDLVNDTPSVRLFTDLVSPELVPVCEPPTSRVTLRISDRMRGDSIAWTRCSQSSLPSLSGEGPDRDASRVTQAAALVRNFTLAQQRGFRYNHTGSLPFATLHRGQSASSLNQPRVIEDEQSWRAFWAEATSTDKAPPAVDFDVDIVLVGVVGVRHETGDSVEIRGVLPVRTATQVSLWEQRASHFCTPARRTHIPFHVVIFPDGPDVPRPIFFSDVSLDTIPCG